MSAWTPAGKGGSAARGDRGQPVRFMGMVWALWSTCLLSATGGAGALPALSQFELQLSLAVESGYGVVPLTLPLAVYQHARSADLSDVRVFNGQGQAVPFAWVDWFPSAGAAASSPVRNATRQFPLHGPDAGVAAPTALPLRLEFESGGALRSVDVGRERGSARTPAELRSLVLDLLPPNATARLQTLHFTLPSGFDAEYRALLAIDRSEDLRWWTPVAQAPLTWLRDASGTSLVQDIALLPAGTGRFARLRWLEGVPLVFANVEARWQAPDRRDPEPPLLIQRFEGQPGRQPGDWIYAVPPALSAQQLGVELPEANTVLPVAIGRYLGNAGPDGRNAVDGVPRFQVWLRSTFYRLDYQGRERRSGLLQIAPLTQSPWVMRAETTSLPARAPLLELRWTPRTLLFNTRGGGPFILAAGAPVSVAREWPDAALRPEQVAPGFHIDELLQLVPARVGVRLSAHAPATRVVDVQPAADVDAALRRKWILWAVLVGGVGVLLILSWRLYRQTQKQMPPADGP